ncbi:MAG: hypothetical protein ABGZ36_11555 [Actinomycetota bacterium]
MSDARQRSTTPVVELSVEGHVGTDQRARAVEHVTGVLESHGVDATSIEIRLEQAIPHPRRRAHGRATAEIPGHVLVVHADADTLDEVVAQMTTKLRQRLDHTVDRRRTRRRRARTATPTLHTEATSNDRADTRQAG